MTILTTWMTADRDTGMYSTAAKIGLVCHAHAYRGWQSQSSDGCFQCSCYRYSEVMPQGQASLTYCCLPPGPTQVLQHRHELPEATLHALSSHLTAQLRRNLTREEQLELQQRDTAESQELGLTHIASTQAFSGRQTGTLEWRIARGEMGLETDSSRIGTENGGQGSSGTVKERPAVDECVGALAAAIGAVCQPAIWEGNDRINGKTDVDFCRSVMRLCRIGLRQVKSQPYRRRAISIDQLRSLEKAEACDGLDMLLAVMAAVGFGRQTKDDGLWLDASGSCPYCSIEPSRGR